MLMIRMFSYSCLWNLILLALWEVVGSEWLPRVWVNSFGIWKMMWGAFGFWYVQTCAHNSSSQGCWRGILIWSVVLGSWGFAVPFVSLSSSLRPEKMCLILRVTCKDSGYELSRGQACLPFSFLLSEFLALSLAWKDLVNIDGRKD